MRRLPFVILKLTLNWEAADGAPVLDCTHIVWAFAVTNVKQKILKHSIVKVSFLILLFLIVNPYLKKVRGFVKLNLMCSGFWLVIYKIAVFPPGKVTTLNNAF